MNANIETLALRKRLRELVGTRIIFRNAEDGGKQVTGELERVTRHNLWVKVFDGSTKIVVGVPLEWFRGRAKD